MIKMVKVRPMFPPSLVTESEREAVIKAQKIIAAAGTRASAKVPTAEAASVPPTIRTRKLAAVVGRAAWAPGLTMGGLATAIELLSARWLVRGLASGTREAMQGFVAGMLFRLLGIAVFAGLVL